jgi:hypothetical protein
VGWHTLCRTCVYSSSGICGSHGAFQCVLGVKSRGSIFHARVGPVWMPQKACWHTLRRTCVFTSGDIYRSHTAFWCVHGVKRHRTILHDRLGPVLIPQKVHQDMIHQTCVFASCRICGSHSAFRCVGAQNNDALFFMPGWDRYGFDKKHVGSHYAELLFGIW